MFFHTVEIPRITAAHLVVLQEMMPGFSNVAKVNPIHTKEEAFDAAVKSAHKVLATSEYVKCAREVTETETGWKFRLEVWGD